jgi:nucleotide-binding universal stress UspA family protein
MNGKYRILLAVDLKEGTTRLLEQTQRFASALDAIVDVIHVSASDPDFIGYIKGPADDQTQIDVEREIKTEKLLAEQQEIRAISETLRQKGVNVQRSLTEQGDLPSALFECISKLNPDLLILGAHHHGSLYRLWYGDIAVDTVKNPPCTILVVPI